MLTNDPGSRIETGIFLIVGHPVETETEFQETLDFLSRNRDIISRVEAVNVCALHKISVLTQNARKYGVCNPENSGGWFSENGQHPRSEKPTANSLAGTCSRVRY